MIITLLGPGNIDFHYYELLKISKKDFNSQLEQLAQALVEKNVAIEFLPDRGVCFELAKLYKKMGGKKVIATLPLSDKTFGVEHLKPYLDEKVDGKLLFDETIDTSDWFKHDLIKGLLGNAILHLGISPGTSGEFNYAIYLHNLFSGGKGGIKTASKNVHPEIRADKNFTAFIYSPFISSKHLPMETESYLDKYGIDLVYLDEPEQLRKELFLLK